MIRTSTVRAEFGVLLRLALPVMAANVGWMALGLVDTFMVGGLGPRALAAVALGDVWIFGTLLLGMGVMMGLDPIVSQAHGAGRGDDAGRALQRGIVLAAWLAVPITLAWLACGKVLVLLGEDPALAADAQRFVTVQIFGVAPFLVYTALRQYLQARGIMTPALVVVLLANAVNAFLNWVFIYGRLGMPAMGIRGSGLSTGITRVGMMLALAGMVAALELHKAAWVPWQRSAFAPGALREILSYGLPIGAQLGLEMWAFYASTLFAGWLGAEALAAHTIVMKLASLSFMVPLGVGVAAATRVGNLLGAGDARGAQRAAWVALGLGAGVMVVSAVAFTVWRVPLPRLFLGGAHPEVVAMAAAILPIAAAFQVFDGTQVVGCGVLRGMGNTRPAALFNFIGYWILALPCALWLAFSRGTGLAGIWIGLAVGLGAVALALVAYIARRGKLVSETR